VLYQQFQYPQVVVDPNGDWQVSPASVGASEMSEVSEATHCALVKESGVRVAVMKA
jgi:hypothetical protein